MLITRQEASVTPELGEQSKLAEQKRDALGVGIAGEKPFACCWNFFVGSE